jgi:galactonate dehydratase
VNNWGKDSSSGPYEDLEGFLYRADELAESLIAEGFMGMKIRPFDPYAEASRGHYISTEELKKGLEPFEKIRKRVGGKIEIMVEMHSLWDLRTAKQIAHALEDYRPFWYEDPIKMDNLDALKEFAQSIRFPTAASETLGLDGPIGKFWRNKQLVSLFSILLGRVAFRKPKKSSQWQKRTICPLRHMTV